VILLLDIGNSRTKWALLGPEGLGPSGARAHGGGTELLPDDIPVVPKQVYAANVAGPQAAELLRGAVQGRWACPLVFARAVAVTGPVRNGYADCQQLGVDRWMAILAAYERCSSGVCVVDAGTATTVDLVAAGGQHLGGFILPGVDLMVRSLMDATGELRRLDEGSPADETPQPATATGRAMRDGAWLATAGLVDRALGFLGNSPQVVVTGGQGERLTGLLGARFVAALVLEGLALSWHAGAGDG
jgi:type III pantothenate kinase